MDDRLRFHPLVVSDLHNAVDWYDGISLGLSNRFRVIVDDRFDAIEERPESFRPHSKIRGSPESVVSRIWFCFGSTMMRSTCWVYFTARAIPKSGVND